jgi:hypothetical protein
VEEGDCVSVSVSVFGFLCVFDCVCLCVVVCGDLYDQLKVVTRRTCQDWRLTGCFVMVDSSCTLICTPMFFMAM